MGFYMLCLSCLPCNDSIECNVKEQATISVVTDDHSDHNHTEACTPFCACACCASTTWYVPYIKAQENKITLVQQVKYPVYNTSFTSQVHSAIWQPPKMA